MKTVVNIEKCFEKFDDLFSPKIIAQVNDQHFKIVRLEGDKIPWHTHDNEDELFLVIEGSIEIHERTSFVKLDQGELYVIEKGIEHKVVPIGYAKIALVESIGIEHTGKVNSEITKKNFDWIVE